VVAGGLTELLLPGALLQALTIALALAGTRALLQALAAALAIARALAITAAGSVAILWTAGRAGIRIRSTALAAAGAVTLAVAGGLRGERQGGESQREAGDEEQVLFHVLDVVDDFVAGLACGPGGHLPVSPVFKSNRRPACNASVCARGEFCKGMVKIPGRGRAPLSAHPV